MHIDLTVYICIYSSFFANSAIVLVEHPLDYYTPLVRIHQLSSITTRVLFQ